MSTAAQHPTPYEPSMGTLRELRAALAGLRSLGLPDELATFEAELETTNLDQVGALADRYRDYVRRNTTSEALAALTMSPASSAAELRLVFCQSAEYIRTRSPEHLLVGLGPILVDATDGSLHLIPVTTYVTGEWEDLYRHDVKGLARPDPVVSLVGAVLEAQGTVAALRELRRNAPGMSIGQAREYVAALATHQTPRTELAELTRPPEVCPPLPITTLTLAPVPVPDLRTGIDLARHLGYYRELATGDEQAPSMLPFLHAGPDKDDVALISYLRAGTLLAATTSIARCRLTPEGPSLGSMALLTDGTWLWPSDLAHYVEQHHLRLPPDFVNHARSNSWVPPQVSPQRLRDLEIELCGVEAPDA